jgi:hypothetical protein
MSRIFTDTDLLTWEVYGSGGAFGLPDQPKIVFHSLSDPHRPARYVTHDGHSGEAEQAVREASVEKLREMLRQSEPL